MGRTPCCEKNGLKKGPWTAEEDQKLIDYIQKHGYGNWRTLPKNAGLQRCGKSCRLRWTNYLRPDIKRGRFSFEEEETIIQLHCILGNKWSAIASRLPGRTDNEIKNYWNTHIRKRLLRMGIDPVTHTPRLDLLDISSILGASLYGGGSSQSLLGMNMNSELLKLASSLISSHQQNQIFNITQFQNQQQIPQNFQVQQVPLTQPQLVESKVVDTYPNLSSFTDFSNYQQHPQLIDWDKNAFTDNNDHYVPQLSSYFNDQNLMCPPLTETSTFQSNNSYRNFNFASVMSTPSSSPTPLNSNSTTTHINGSNTEDEKESYESSNLLKFEVPSESLDVNDYLM